jgi:hypothetical protein
VPYGKEKSIIVCAIKEDENNEKGRKMFIFFITMAR